MLRPAELTQLEARALRQAARAELWRRTSAGEVSVDWFLHDAQVQAAQALRASKSLLYYLSVGRQWGKSLLLVALVLEEAWGNPGCLIHWWSPYRDDAVDIFTQKARIVLADCPVALRPRLNGQTVQWRFSNGSEVHFFGANNDRGRFARGRTVRRIIIDEAAEVDDLQSLTDEICMPMLLHSPGGSIWMSSTPSKVGDHVSYVYVRNALLAGDCFRATIYDNPLLMPEQVAKHCTRAGGHESPTWRREYLADLDVVDPEAVLVPEFSKLRTELTAPWQRPGHYQHLKRLVVLDRGGDTDRADGTGITWWTFDFPTQLAVCERSLLLRQPSTSEICRAIKTAELELWGADAKPDRVADGILAKDYDEHGLSFGPVSKDDRDSAIALLRTSIGAKRIRFLPAAASAITQMQYAHTRKGRLARTEQGHYDVFDTVLYANRYIQEHLKYVNPIPVPVRRGYEPTPTSSILKVLSRRK